MVFLFRSHSSIWLDFGCVCIVLIAVSYLLQHTSVPDENGEYLLNHRTSSHILKKHGPLQRDPKEQTAGKDGRVAEEDTTSSTRVHSTTSEQQIAEQHQRTKIRKSTRDEHLATIKEHVEASGSPTMRHPSKLASSHARKEDIASKEREWDRDKQSNGDKIILFWTRFNIRKPDSWWEPPGGFVEALDDCIYKNCRFTREKRLVRGADLVVFKERYLARDGIDWPTNRSPRQLYVHVLGERPGPWHDFLRQYNDRINLTMNYRASADIATPHKALYKKEPPLLEPYKLRVPFRQKSGMVVWAVSNCEAESRRQDYVKELAKYISVDVYGACGNLTCEGRKSALCYSLWEQKYKFYLSFENAICDDYVTEKYHKPLKYELVPVVLSGHRYNSRTPPHSAIDVRDFSSPQDLARYLTRVGSDEAEYTRYFQWKQRYVFRASIPGPLCGLCTAANTVYHRPAYRDYYGWWFGACDNGLVDRMRATGNW